VSDNPFPRERVSAMLRRMPAYLRLSWRLGKDPLLNKARRAAVVAAAGYLASPIDLVPGVVPLLGQLDDIAFALAAIKIALAGLDAERRQAHLDAVGLADSDLSDDLRAIGATTLWLGRATFRTTRRVVTVGGGAAGSAARTTARAAGKTTPVAKAAITRAVPIASAAGRTALTAGTAAGSAGRTAGRAAASAGGKAAILGGMLATTAETAIGRLQERARRGDSGTPAAPEGERSPEIEMDATPQPPPAPGSDAR
jgi:uncharacterized membrane protein YkvA (DUF1232 family)